MARSTVCVTVASLSDRDRLIPLWVQLRAETGQTKEWAQRAAQDGRMEAALSSDAVRVFLATSDEVDTGFAVVIRSPLSGLGDEQAVWIDQMWVAPDHRGTGVAKALLSRVSAYGEEQGSTQVVCCVPTQARGVNRYFAKLGFAATVTLRVTSTASLRRKLTGVAESKGAATLRQRRSLRARARDDMKVASGL